MATSAPDLPGLLTAVEAMELLRVSRSTLTRWRSEGIVRAVRVHPGAWPRYRADELRELIDRGGPDDTHA